MDRVLICSVLGVSPDTWPPDHYTLIGLRPADANPAAVEARVHELSTRLRPYQLVQPDAATDALNRLAQALVCLTDPVSRVAYDATLAAPDMPLTVLPADSIARPPSAPRPRLTKLRGQASHRLVYRRLAVARRLRAAWREAGAVLGQPTWRLNERADAIEFVQSLWRMRDCAADPAAPAITGLGALVVDISRRTRLLHDLRRMSSRERGQLAVDWREGLTVIEREILTLRTAVRRRSPLPRPLVRAVRFLLTDGLDLMLFLLGLAAIAIAIARSRN